MEKEIEVAFYNIDYYLQLKHINMILFYNRHYNFLQWNKNWTDFSHVVFFFYRMTVRQKMNIILQEVRRFQQYFVDQYIHANQLSHAEFYQGLNDTVTDDDMPEATAGSKVVFLATFIGSSRSMIQLYQVCCENCPLVCETRPLHRHHLYPS